MSTSARQHSSNGDCLELRRNIIRTAPCWVVWHNVYSQQHTHMSSSYRSSRLRLSYWNPYAMHRDGCLELYYCNMVEWSWWDSSLICKTNWFPSLLWHCWFGHMLVAPMNSAVAHSIKALKPYILVPPSLHPQPKNHHHLHIGFGFRNLTVMCPVFILLLVAVV